MVSVHKTCHCTRPIPRYYFSGLTKINMTVNFSRDVMLFVATRGSICAHTREYTCAVSAHTSATAGKFDLYIVWPWHKLRSNIDSRVLSAFTLYSKHHREVCQCLANLYVMREQQCRPLSSRFSMQDWLLQAEEPGTNCWLHARLDLPAFSIFLQWTLNSLETFLCIIL